MSSLFCLRKPDNASQIESNRQIPWRKPNAVIQLLRRRELHPVKRTEKNRKFSQPAANCCWLLFMQPRIAGVFPAASGYLNQTPSGQKKTA